MSDIPRDEVFRIIRELEKQMKDAATALEFEKAALLRDQIMELRHGLEQEQDLPEWEKYRVREQSRAPGSMRGRA